MTNDKYKMVQDLADGWRAKYEDAKQQLVKAQRAIDEHTYWKAKALDLEVKRDIAVSTLEKVKADRATAQKALAAQCEETKKLRAELATARKGGVTFFGEEDGDKYRCAECGHTWNAIDAAIRARGDMK